MERESFLKSILRWTVSELTIYLRELLETDQNLQDVWVQGEVSNLARPSSGHIYFTLKDSSASLRCIMWRNSAIRLDFNLQDGMLIEVHGSLGIYEPQGQYQLYIDTIRPLGEGVLFQEFLRLKALLEAEGLFDEGRKRPIPELPRKIGIVTSPTGAALRDILDTLSRRYPLGEVILSPTPVQGDDAPLGIVSALNELNRIEQPDVILLARGGGSIEDLWAFNDERVVRAVHASQAPIITGIGHETDFTLVDFAADSRAPTPTAAAELASPVTTKDMLLDILEVETMLSKGILACIDRFNLELDTRIHRLSQASPYRFIQTEIQRLDELLHRCNTVQLNSLDLSTTRLRGLESRLSALDPLNVLKRGYAIVTRKEDNTLVSKESDAISGDDLEVLVEDGVFDVRVMER